MGRDKRLNAMAPTTAQRTKDHSLKRLIGTNSRAGDILIMAAMDSHPPDFFHNASSIKTRTKRLICPMVMELANGVNETARIPNHRASIRSHFQQIQREKKRDNWLKPKNIL